MHERKEQGTVINYDKCAGRNNNSVQFSYAVVWSEIRSNIHNIASFTMNFNKRKDDYIIISSDLLLFEKIAI